MEKPNDCIYVNPYAVMGIASGADGNTRLIMMNGEVWEVRMSMEDTRSHLCFGRFSTPAYKTKTRKKD